MTKTEHATLRHVSTSPSWSEPEPESDDSAPGPASVQHAPPLFVRPFALRDVPALARFPGTMRLDVPDSLVLPQTSWFGIPAALPVLRKERPTFVALADGHQVGFVRISTRRPDGRWVVSAIAASTGVYSPEPVWESLLGHAVRAGGLRGVRRLFARVPAGHPVIDVMRRSGWTPYATESVFRATRLDRGGEAALGIRRQELADTWAIHQLYLATVPRHVQEVEAITSHVWHMDERLRARTGPRQAGWLLTDGGQLAAYARQTSSSRTAMIDAVIAPGMRGHLGALLDHIAAVRGDAGTRATYFALRGYLSELKDELTARGFAEIGDQELLIRYTTATARTAAIDPVHFPVELRPAVPRRVPTFLEGQPTDGAL